MAVEIRPTRARRTTRRPGAGRRRPRARSAPAASATERPPPAAGADRVDRAVARPERLLRRVPGGPRRHRSTIPPQAVTAIIGPSGCGKSTFLRTLNRMHELIPGRPGRGRGRSSTAPTSTTRAIDPVQLRRVVGMVFQRPNPFPTMSIYDNVVAGLRLTGRHPRSELDEIVERSLRRAALWDEVKDKLKQSRARRCRAASSSGCASPGPWPSIPRCILMDEPARPSTRSPRSGSRSSSASCGRATRSSSSPTTCSRRRGSATRRRSSRWARIGPATSSRSGRHAPDLHEPAEPADRGLRLRSVRLRRRDVTHEQDNGRTGDHGPGPRRRRSWPRAGRPSGRRSTAASARSRTPSCGWASSSRTRSSRRSTRSSGTTPTRPLRVIQDDRRINEAQCHLSSLIATVIATQQPVARDLRFLLSLDHVTYELERMGDHAASVAKQARKLAPFPPPGTYVELPEMARLTAALVRGILGALVDIDEVAGPRRSRPATTRSTSSTTGPSTKTLDRHARRPGQRRPGDPDPVRRPLPRADRRPGDEHRRGHRVPRDRRDRGPQPLIGRPTDRGLTFESLEGVASAR